MELNVKALSITSGIFWGVTLFWTVLAGGVWGINTFWASPEAAQMATYMYPGITFTIGGAFLALIWGLFCGVLCGGIFGYLYNKISRRIS